MFNKTMHELGSKRSTIRELFEYGKKAKEKFGADKVYDFSLGNPSTPPPSEVTEAMLGLISENEPCALHGYSSAQGDKAVREAIASDLKSRYNASISPDMIYMTCGAAAALSIVLRALVCENNGFIVQAPFFPEYKVFIESMGGVIDIAEADTDTFEINIPAIAALINENTQGIIINSPNNPSGKIYDEQTLTALSKLLTERSKEYGHPIYIISDEPYRELTYGKKVPYIPSIYPNTVICYSYSKSLSLPGERIGYIAIPDSVTDKEELYAAICGSGRALGYVCAPTLMQKVIKECIGVPPCLEDYRKNRDTLFAALTAMGYSCVVPEGAFYLFVKAPGGDSIAFSETAKKFNLLLVPGDDFGCPGFLRISYCVSYETVRNSLPAFGKAIDKYL